MAESMRLYLELIGRSGNLRSELNSSRSAVTRFTSGVKRELSALGNMARSVTGQLAAIGVGFSAVRIAADSARMDKSLTRTKQTAGATAREMAVLRQELFTMARHTGQPIEELQKGFDGLVQSGLEWKSALEAIKAINIGSAVTGAQSGVLSGGLTVGATAFNFDLSKPGLALALLDKMTVAGRQGNAELENLSDIFSRVGVNAASAGMGFDQTLAFIEGLSLIERQPERLATLADSTLRLFTNMKYMKDAQKATGVRFFDQKGERRDAMAIIGDIKKRYDTLKTDQQRAAFIQKAFGHADLDTQKGMKTFLDGTALAQVNQFTQEIENAGGTLKRDFGEATNNLVDQVGMLKNDLKEAADRFVKPMNETLSGWIKWARQSKDQGGAGLDGEAMIKYGIGGAAGALLLGRYGGKAAARLFSGAGGLAGGLVQGKAFEEFAGVTPVFVVNMPGSVPMITGSGDNPVKNMLAASALAGTVPAVAATATAGVGYMMYRDATDQTKDNSGMFAGFGAESGGGFSWGALFDLMRQEREPVKNDIKMDITIDQAGRATSSTDDPNTKASINTKRRGNFAEPDYF